jgi:hypothetical protein
MQQWEFECIPSKRRIFVMPELKMTRVKRLFPSDSLMDIAGEVHRQLASMTGIAKSGSRIALAVGSRGIRELQTVVREVVAWVKNQACSPFIVPAMGSHGGATAEGQREILAGYGITEENVGAPVVSSMEVVELPQGDFPYKIFYDKQASAANATILINRIKPHTDFHGPHESGLLKMIVIGLGKQHQALQMHRLGAKGLREGIFQVARQSLRVNNVLFGIAIVENARDEICRIQAIPKDLLFEKEPALLELARRGMPNFPLEEFDILMIDEIGKDISGVGLDTNIIGRLKIPGEPEPLSPRIRIIIIRDLSAGTHGNATGMGLADIVTRNLFNKIDFKPTYHNMVTSGFLERAKIPLIAETDRQAIDIALRGCDPLTLEQAKIIRIKNTLHLEELQVSAPVLRKIQARSDIEILDSGEPLFDKDGALCDF